MNRRLLSVVSIVTLLGGVAACAVENDPSTGTEPSEPVAVDAQNLVTNPIGPIFWPMGPITWADGVGTWPIGVWSNTAINWLAFDIAGATNLQLSLSTLDGVGLGITPSLITSSLLSTVGAGPWLGGLTPYYGMLPWMNGLGTYPFYGVPGYVYGLGYYPYVDGLYGAGCGAGACGTLGAPLLDGLLYPGLYPAGLGASTFGGLTTLGASSLTTGFLGLTPAITANALLFPTFPAFVGTTPLLINATFSGVTAATQASLSIFAATASTAALQSSLAIQATMFPILGFPMPVSTLGLGALTPLSPL